MTTPVDSAAAAGITLRAGEHEATVSPRGAALCSWSVGGDEKLAWTPPGHPDHLFDGATLVPWPNRIRDGRYTHEGRRRRLELTEPERSTALHGLATSVDWDTELRTADAARFGHTLGPLPGYPYAVRVEVGYVLSPGGVSVELHAVNHGDERAPFGAGAHPYIRTAGVDRTMLQIPAATVVPLDRRLLPTGRPSSVEGTPMDFRQRRPVGGTALDTTFGDLARSAGTAYVRIWPGESAAAITLWCDGGYRFVHVFSGAPGRLAIEPMTCAPDAFNTGLGLLSLGPGDSVHARWGLAAGGGSRRAVRNNRPHS